MNDLIQKANKYLKEKWSNIFSEDRIGEGVASSPYLKKCKIS